MKRLAALVLASLTFAGCGDDEPTRSRASTAGPAPSGELPDGCIQWFGSGVLALVCDPGASNGGGFRITAAGKSTEGQEGTGVAQLGGTEPFRDGDEATFVLRGGSPRTHVAFLAAARATVEPIVVAPLDPPAERYEVRIEGASAIVTADTGAARVIPIGSDEEATEQVAAGTPAELLQGFAKLMSGGEAELERACGLLAADTRAALSAGGYPCGGFLALLVRHDEYGEYPEYESSSVSDVDVVERAGLTIARTRIRHRFEPSDRGQPSSKTVTALVPVAREDGGWRIVLPDALSPNRALDGSTEPTDDELRTRIDAVRNAAGSARSAERDRERATVDVHEGAESCSSGSDRTVSDPASDVTLADGGDRARRQDDIRVDAVRATHANDGARVCFSLEFRTELPEQFSVELSAHQPGEGDGYVNDRVTVQLEGGRAVAARGEDDEREYLSPAVVMSEGRRSLLVRFDARAAWPGLDVGSPYRWAVDIFEAASEIRNAYLEQIPENQMHDESGGVPSP